MNIEMNKHQKILGFLLLGTILLFGVLGVSSAAKEEGYFEEHEEYDEHNRKRGDNKYSKSVIKQDAIYTEECGSCHLAYPANLLPSESWHDIMTGLAEHFDESAELDKDTTEHIGNYLQQNALKKAEPSRFSRMLRNIPEKAPLRITELPYFIHEHDEIPNRMVANNPEVGSFSNCEKCHKDAAGGLFDEDLVVIPGFGRWDD